MPIGAEHPVGGHDGSVVQVTVTTSGDCVSDIRRNGRDTRPPSCSSRSRSTVSVIDCGINSRSRLRMLNRSIGGPLASNASETPMVSRTSRVVDGKRRSDDRFWMLLARSDGSFWSWAIVVSGVGVLLLMLGTCGKL